jgi:hypothetical protein
MSGFIEAFLAAIVAALCCWTVAGGFIRQAMIVDAGWAANALVGAALAFAGFLPLMLIGLAPVLLPMRAVPVVMVLTVILLIAITLSGLIPALGEFSQGLFGAAPGRIRQICAGLATLAFLFFLV